MAKEDNFSQYMPYFIEFRKKLISVVIAFFIGLIIGLLFSKNILLFFLKLFNFSGVNLVMTSPTQIIDLSIFTGLYCGLLLALPVLAYQLLAFLKPALKAQEYRLIISYLPIGIILFIGGTIFGVWITQLIIYLFSSFSSGFSVNNIWDIQRMFSFTIMTAFLTGLIFQMPLVMTCLIRLKIVKRQYLVSKRQYVYAILLILVVLLPPTDILSSVIITIPLLLLYEIALLLNRGQP